MLKSVSKGYHDWCYYGVIAMGWTYQSHLYSCMCDLSSRWTL